MKITDEMMDYLSQLAKIRMSEEEQIAAKAEIEKIITYMDVLNTVDTEDVEAMSHAFALKNVFRQDEVLPSVLREEILSNAPAKKDGCFQVPKTVE